MSSNGRRNSKFKQYSEDRLLEAIDTVKKSRHSLRATANLYGIPRSTLQRYVKYNDDEEIKVNSSNSHELKGPSNNHELKGPHKALSCEIRAIAMCNNHSIYDLSQQMKSKGNEIYQLSLGQSPFDIPQCVIDELRENAFQKDYLDVAGLLSLRQNISIWAENRLGIEFSQDNVLVGPGTKELLFILQSVYYGDILLPNPSCISYAPQAKIAGRNMFWLSTNEADRWVLKPEILENHCELDPDAPRILILNSPSNPTGCAYRKDELLQLAVIARKYRILVVSDEIYAEMHHRTEACSISQFYPEGTIVSGGLSKWCGAGGWRIGFWLFPNNLGWLRQAMIQMASETYTSVASPIQYAAKRAFVLNCEEIGSYIVQSRVVLRIVAEWCVTELEKMNVDVQLPDGGFYVFPSFRNYSRSLQDRGIYSDVEMCKKLLHDTGIVIVPGSVFGRSPSELYARVAFVDFDGTAALEYVKKVEMETIDPGQFMREYCPRIFKAIDELVKWLIKGPMIRA